MRTTRFLILCLAAAARSADAVAPEDEPGDGAQADVLFQVRSGGRVQQVVQEDAPLKESQPHHRYGCDKFTTRTRINNDEVEHELSYARTGSDIPEALHGLFWMDQRGVNVNRQTTGRSYRQKGSMAADELLAAFGDASWDANSRCLSPVPPFGGQQGHWTWLDQDGAFDNNIYNINCGVRANIRFCCRDRHCNHIDLASYVNAQDASEFLSSNDWHGLGTVGTFISNLILAGLHLWNGHGEHFWLPTNVMAWEMHRKPWGFDRVSITCPHCWWWLQKRYHYPLFRIVDGNGQRTEHYEAYLRFANRDTNARESTFQQAMNRGNGTSFVGRCRSQAPCPPCCPP